MPQYCKGLPLTSSMSNETVDLPSMSIRLGPNSVDRCTHTDFCRPLCTPAMFVQEESRQSLLHGAIQ